MRGNIMHGTYEVTQEFMDALIKWHNSIGNSSVSASQLFVLPKVVDDWLVEPDYLHHAPMESNRRLIALISWVNGKDYVFEVEKSHKFAVRSVKPDVEGDYWWMYLQNSNYGLEIPVYSTTIFARAKQFDTREEAGLWTTNGYEVVEIDEDGNKATK